MPAPSEQRRAVLLHETIIDIAYPVPRRSQGISAPVPIHFLELYSIRLRLEYYPQMTSEYPRIQ